MDFVIKNLQQLKQVHKNLIDDENHLHLLLNPNQRRKIIFNLIVLFFHHTTSTLYCKLTPPVASAK